jgi:hypothetical protein
MLQVTLLEIQEAAAPSITALDWDDLSITMEYSAGSSSGSSTGGTTAGYASDRVESDQQSHTPCVTGTPSMRLPLVKGSPYVTFEVPSPARPLIRGPGNGGGVITGVTQISPNKLKIQVGSVPGGEGRHTFLLWGSSPVGYTLAGDSVEILGTASCAGSGEGAPSGKFAGMVRLAWVPDESAAGAESAAAVEAMLDAHVDAVPVGGTVKAWADSTAKTASYSLNWLTKSMTGAATPTSQLLMLALPHHLDTMTVPSPSGVDLGQGLNPSSPQPAESAFPLGFAPAGSSGPGLSGTGVYTSQPPQGSGRSGFDYGVYVMTVRGPQVPVVGSMWLLQDQFVPLRSEAQAAAALHNPEWRSEIERALVVSGSQPFSRVLYCVPWDVQDVGCIC